MNLLFWYRSLMRSAGAALVKLVVTATSGLVSFTTNVIRPVKVTCEFSPVQEGTGDPSPNNVRPISGWTGCEITHISSNLADVAWERGAISGDSTGSLHLPYAEMKTSLNTRIRVQDLISVDPHGIYLATVDFNAYELVLQRYDASGRSLASNIYAEIGAWLTEPTRFTSYSQNIALAIRRKDGAAITVSELSAANPQVINTATMESIPITFTDPSTGDPLTVYGGTVTLNEDGSADLVLKWKTKKLNDTAKSYFSLSQTGLLRTTGETVKTVVFPGTRLPANGTSASAIKCEMLKAVGSSGITYSQEYHGTFAITPYGRLYICDTECITVNDYFAKYGDVTFCYPLATPQTYHFPNIAQLNTFLGENNIWHNMNGDITVEYWNKQ